jgi:hypothetical protein
MAYGRAAWDLGQPQLPHSSLIIGKLHHHHVRAVGREDDEMRYDLEAGAYDAPADGEFVKDGFTVNHSPAPWGAEKDANFQT